MSRQNRKRILCDEGVYHVFNRGNNKQELFREEEDFIRFKFIVAHYKKKFKFLLFHYCFMLNHFHFLMRIAKAETLPRLMQGISQTYAKYYQEKYGTVGYLFQGRYKSLPIEKDEYLLVCARYIERNPLRAGIVKELSEYRWSSYNYYAKGAADDIVDCSILYDTFGHTVEERQRNYINFVTITQPHESLLDKIIDEVMIR